MDGNPDAFEAAANSGNRQSRHHDKKEWAKQRQFCNFKYAVSKYGIAQIRQIATGFIALTCFLVAASVDIAKTSFLVHLKDLRQMWAPEVAFIITVCLDAFIFIFFLAGIDTSVEFFENNQNIGKHLKTSVPMVFGLLQAWSFIMVSTQASSVALVFALIFGFVSCLCHLFPTTWLPTCCMDIPDDTSDQESVTDWQNNV